MRNPRPATAGRASAQRPEGALPSLRNLLRRDGASATPCPAGYGGPPAFAAAGVAGTQCRAGQGGVRDVRPSQEEEAPATAAAHATRTLLRRLRRRSAWAASRGRY